MPGKSDQPKQFYQGVGRRKTSTATVRLFDEKGEVLVNGRPIEEYFPGEAAKAAYRSPFTACGMGDKFSGQIRVSGGGKSGQLGAVVLGISRALLAYDESFRPALRRRGLLTRDPRMKERKKVFRRGARRSPQYSKR